MIAASALVVAVLASYAGIGMLSLNASSPFSALSKLPVVSQVVSGIGFSKPKLASALKVRSQATPSSAAFSDVSFVNFGAISDTQGHVRKISIANHSSNGLALQVDVPTGSPSIAAQFSNGQKDYTVPPRGHATVVVTQNPLYAGPFAAQVQISAAGLSPIQVQVSGDQAPLAPGPVTATAAAGGAVNLSWTPSGSISGVAGYIVERSSDGGATFQQIAGPLDATTYLDHTPSDALYSYRVVAVATGPGALPSSPGPAGTVTSDSTPPVAPSQFAGLPAYINASTVGQPFNVTVQLPPGSQPSDTIAVTVRDSSGATFTRTAAGGGATAQVSFDATQFAQGPLTFTATATDAVGNSSSPLALPGATTVDTIAPLAPTSVSTPPVIATGNAAALPVTVQVPSTVNPNNELDVSMQGVTGPARVQKFTVAQAGAPLSFDASALPDGLVTVAAWVVDAAGNQSAVTPADPQPTKNTAGPPAPTQFQIAAGPNNPVNVVTPQSASAVYITATFAQAPPATDEIKVFGDNRTLVDQPGDGQTTSFTFGPFDFSDLPAGSGYKIGMNQIDALGNDTWSQFKFAVDSGVSGPTSVGVPAGPNNPAGYVNAATQTAATIVATFAAPTDPADQIALSVGGLSLGTQAGGSDTVSWTGDLSSLPDGTLQILGTITDPNGVQTTFTGSLIKEVTPPPVPAAAGVAGPPPNTITPQNASCVNVGVAFNQAPDPTDTVTVTLSDGSTSVQGSAPAGDGQVTVSCLDASSLSAGPVSVTVTVTDTAGNSVTFTGTPAVKVDCQQQGTGNSNG